MKNKNIISKLKTADLRGRGGADFPTYLKWQIMADTVSSQKYIVANGSEGEPNVLKDGYILKNYPELLVEGLKIALDTFKGSRAFIFLRRDYYKKYKKKLEKLIGKMPITVFREHGGYLSGEETVLCEEIEKNLPARPRTRPPFPGQAGVYGLPTLINNVETFYYVAKIARGEYKKTRLYSITGKVPYKGVFELPVNMAIKQILAETKNTPEFDYFVQIGGGASGDVLLSSETNKLVNGSGAIVVYDKEQTDPWVLMHTWIDFFMRENCDKCTPCREGTYRILEMIRDRKFDKKILEDLFFVLENTSYCALGRSIPLPFRSAIKKLL
ncbi:MAG: NADH-ubiquinone oxidoreductase-F iron-sulfur binding region domain-containing protein [Patescibacteria group bacterium]